MSSLMVMGRVFCELVRVKSFVFELTIIQANDGNGEDGKDDMDEEEDNDEDD